MLLKATIATDGTVRDAQVVKSVHPDLDNAAIDAVRQWIFDGTLLNCAPTEVTMNVLGGFRDSVNTLTPTPGFTMNTMTR